MFRRLLTSCIEKKRLTRKVLKDLLSVSNESAHRKGEKNEKIHTTPKTIIPNMLGGATEVVRAFRTFLL